jgi:hypothetical protein
MDEQFYLETRAKLQSELKALQAKIDALDVVWRDIMGNHGEIPATGLDVSMWFTNGPDIRTFTDVVNAGFVGKLIESVSEGMAGIFGVSEVEGLIKRQYPHLEVNRTTVAGKLKEMADGGKLELIEAGSGRRSSSYRNTQKGEK